MLEVSRAIFILLLLFAPTAFGSVEPWAFFFLTLLSGMAFLSYLTHGLLTGRPFYRVPGFIPLLLLAILLVFQLIPLPNGLLGFLSPHALLFRRETTGLLTGAAPWPISLDIGGGIYELARFLVCCGCYVLTVQLLTDAKTLKRVVLTLAFFGGLLALFSILQSIFTVDRILWFRGVPENARPFGPYVCRNHYAGLMEMLCPLTLALVFVYRPPRQFGTRREKIIGFFEDADFPVFILLCVSAVLMALSVFMSLSRGGIFSLCLSILLFLLFIVWTGSPTRRSGRIRAAVILVFALVLAVSWFGWNRLDQRFGELGAEINGMSPESRYQVLKDGLTMSADFPVLGAGFGSFRNVFPGYHSVAPYHLVDYAHNDYLQLLTEGGIVGLFLFLLFFLCLFRATFRALKKRIEPYAVLVCLGAMTGITAILCHSLVDFNLHINANTLYFTFLCGLMVSAAHTRFRTHLSPGTYLEPYRPKIKWLVLMLFCLLWLPLLVYSAGRWTAAHYTAPFKNITITAGMDPIVRRQVETAATRSSRLDPFNASYRIMSGDAAYIAGDFEKARVDYRQAIMLVPTRAGFLQKAGWAAYHANGDVEHADALMSAGVDFYPAQPVLYGRYAAFLLKAGRSAQARDIIRKGLTLDPRKAGMFFDIMRAGKMTPAEMYAALTDNSLVWYTFASYIRNTDYAFMNKEILAKAVKAADREAAPPPQVYLSLARLYAGEKNIDEAIAVLKKGVAKLPHNADLLYETALMYDRLQITYKAVEFYKKVLLINPGYDKARKRLAELTG